MDKEQFWKSLKGPVLRGCWNCVRNNDGSCLEGDTYKHCNGYVSRNSSMHPDDDDEELLDDNWMAHWEWDGKNE